MVETTTSRKKQAEGGSNEVVLDKRLIIEVLKTLEGLKRVLQEAIK